MNITFVLSKLINTYECKVKESSKRTWKIEVKKWVGAAGLAAAAAEVAIVNWKGEHDEVRFTKNVVIMVSSRDILSLR